MTPMSIDETESSGFPAVTSNSYLLMPDGVMDLDDFAENHESYLVSIYDEPERAVELWHQRYKRSQYPDEGFVSIEHYGRELVNGDLWDQVGTLWSAFVDVAEAFLDTGVGEGLFPDQPVPIVLRRRGSSTLMTIGPATTPVDEETFLPGLLDEAARYFRWVDTHIGVDERPQLDRIAQVRSRLP